MPNLYLTFNLSLEFKILLVILTFDKSSILTVLLSLKLSQFKENEMLSII